MRRSDREITEDAAIDRIIQSCDCCRIGFSDGGDVYIVPLNFAYTHAGGKRIFYFHGASQGRKIRLIKRNPRVGFELDTGHAINRAETPCGFSFRFQSVIGRGTVFPVEDEAEKQTALRLIMAHYSGRSDWTFGGDAVGRCAVFRLEADELTCKEHL